VYLDNASTSYPKPEIVTEAIASYLRDAGCSPGRSGHQRGRASEEVVDRARREVAALLGCPDHRSIAYTYNATYALNMAIKGCLRPGDHVVVSCYEHNSVLRPLEKLRRQGIIDYTVTGLGPDWQLDAQAFREAFRPTTRLAAVAHASNVTGIVTPVQQFAGIAHDKSARVLVDLSQTAGFMDVDLQAWDLDYAAFAGHKSLLGLPGIGGLYVKDAGSLSTVIEGGTGGNSIELVQPEEMPTKFEAGTCNFTGIVALGAAVSHLSDIGLAAVRAHERGLLARAADALQGLDGVTLYAPAPLEVKVPVLSFNIAGRPADEISERLDTEHGIMTRAGLHCAPLAHEALGTSPRGTVRASFGLASTDRDCDRFIEAVEDIARAYGGAGRAVGGRAPSVSGPDVDLRAGRSAGPARVADNGHDLQGDPVPG
jgi:cysteine desulfurase family protein